MILDLPALTALCVAVRDRAVAYHAQTGALFDVMYSTGCREAETTRRDLWAQVAGDAWRLQPLKGNDHRVIQPWVPPVIFSSFVMGSGYPFQLLSSSRLRATFAQLSPFPVITVGAKESACHLFRYRYIRQLQADGLDVAGIKLRMGLRSSQVVQRYLTNPIVVP